jgi:F-type H+-transporting ATPase subunit gamma
VSRHKLTGMDTLETLRRKIESVKELKSVVKTMKAVAASNIGQYEMAVTSLGDYYRTVSLGVLAWLGAERIHTASEKKQTKGMRENPVVAIVFGSDQGLVGQFNDSLANFVTRSLQAWPGKKEIWAVGERIRLFLPGEGAGSSGFFPVPNSVHAITPLVGEILVNSLERHEEDPMTGVYIFHNQPGPGAGYVPVMQRLLPLDEKWMQDLAEPSWPTKKRPGVAGGMQPTLAALIREYLFVSLFRACAGSLASENASRLAAMQRAEKNIGDLLDDLGHRFHRLRQDSIDEELFDVVSGFEALKNKKNGAR